MSKQIRNRKVPTGIPVGTKISICFETFESLRYSSDNIKITYAKNKYIKSIHIKDYTKCELGIRKHNYNYDDNIFERIIQHQDIIGVTQLTKDIKRRRVGKVHYFEDVNENNVLQDYVLIDKSLTINFDCNSGLKNTKITKDSPYSKIVIPKNSIYMDIDKYKFDKRHIIIGV